jgi:hypothetical protein
MKMYGGGGIAPPFLTSALDGGDLLASRPGHLTPYYLFYKKLGSGRCGVEKNLFPLLGIF